MEKRKEQHIRLAQMAQIPEKHKNPFFHYEPLFGVHPKEEDMVKKRPFLTGIIGAPLWVSSMTGGAREAGKINGFLARVCSEFSLGMGLGSCRCLLESDRFFPDFNLRPILGKEVPFYANLGVAQVEKLLEKGRAPELVNLVERLDASGLIIHINPLQEWFQPEGDRYQKAAIESIRGVLEETVLSIIVKEVGQGMGPRSLKALMHLPLQAIEFGAFGGTNFSKLESLRAQPQGDRDTGGKEDFVFVGHSAEEMVDHTNRILEEEERPQCQTFIISGGIRSALRGLRLVNSSKGDAVFAMGEPLLGAASRGYDALRGFVRKQLEELAMARAFLR